MKAELAVVGLNAKATFCNGFKYYSNKKITP
jgi:hypothetical protein